MTVPVANTREHRGHFYQLDFLAQGLNVVSDVRQTLQSCYVWKTGDLLAVLIPRRYDMQCIILCVVIFVTTTHRVSL